MRFPAGAAAAIALCLAAPNVTRVTAQSPSEGIWYCRSTTALDPVYVTPAFSGISSVITLNRAFTDFLAKKYGHTGSGDCTRVPPGNMTHAAVQAMLDRQYATMETNQKKKIVQTGWTNGMPLTPAEGMQPAVIWAACRMGAPKTGGPITGRPQLRYYLSDATPRTEARDEREVEAAFAEFVRGKYAVTGGRAQCVSTTTESDARKSLKGFEDEAAKFQHDVVKTEWMFTPAKPATPPAIAKPAAPPRPTPTGTPAAPAAAAPQTARAPQSAPASALHAVCYGDVDPATKYYSAVFDGSKGDYADWMPAFQKHLEQNYKYRGFVRCNKQPSQAAAEKYRDDLIARSRGAALPGGAKVKIVETGWIYK